MDFPTISNDRYKVKQCIGMGGMAAVFICYDKTLEVYRALKVLRPEMVTRKAVRDRFTSEAIAMAKVNHPNMVHVYDHGMEGLTLFIVMELIPYGSLQDYIEKRGVLNKSQAVEVCLDVAKALQKAHELGIIHRDIKPDNILLSPQGAKLTDFGIARVHVEANQHQTRTQAVMGTFPYMPPEQRLSAKKTNHQSDIYALSATLFVILTQKEPTELYDKEERKLLLDGLDEDIRQVIEKGCQTDLNIRYSNIQDFIEDLQSIVRTKEDGELDLQSPTFDEKEVTDMNELLQIWSEYTGQDDPITKNDSPVTSNQTDTFNFEDDFSDPVFTAPTKIEELPSSQQLPISDTIYENKKQRSIEDVEENTSFPIHKYAIFVIIILSFFWFAFYNSMFTISLTKEVPDELQENSTVSPTSKEVLSSTTSKQIKQLLFETNYSQSERLIKSSIEQNPEDEQLQQMMNMVHILRDRAHLVVNLPQKDETINNPIAELLHLLNDKEMMDKDWKNKIQRTKDKFPNAPIVSHIELLYVQQHKGRERALEVVENMIAQYPQSTALLQEKGKLLYLNQKYELAANILNQVLKRDSYSVQSHRILADLYARKNEVHKSTMMLMMVIDDNAKVSPLEQTYFLEKHAIDLRNIGKGNESIKIANFCIDTASRNELHLSVLSCSYQNLQTSFWLNTKDEWSERQSETMNLLQGFDLKTDYIYEIRFYTKFLEAQSLIQSQNIVQADVIVQQLKRVIEKTDIPQAEEWLSLLKIGIFSVQDDVSSLQEMQQDLDVKAFTTPNSCLQNFVQHRISKSLKDNQRNAQLLRRIIEQNCSSNEELLQTIARIELIKVLERSQGKSSEIQTLITDIDKIWLNPESSGPIVEEYYSIKSKY